MFDLNKIVRQSIKDLKPYSSARDEYKGDAAVFLDANESPYDTKYNRYPDPLQWKLKEKIAGIVKVPEENIFLGNGSDEAIDLLMRGFVEPRTENIVTIDPSYGMYQVCASVNNVELRKVLLTPDFDLDADAILNACDDNTRLIILCSPNNPSSNSFKDEDILRVIKSFDGIVVLDEAYIEFSRSKGFTQRFSEYDNLIVLRTMSKAWGMAGIRLGMAIGNKDIIDILNKIKYPYNINTFTQDKAIEHLAQFTLKEEWVDNILAMRDKLMDELKEFKFVRKVYNSDANFILVKVDDAQAIYDYLKDRGIIVRNRSSQSLCENCLRLTVGSEDENEMLIKSLKEY